jgi:hypothetical protein
VILIHFLLISTDSETFQQTSQTISQDDSDLTENHFSRETEMFLIHNEAPFDKVKHFRFRLESLGAVPNGKKLKYFRGESV